MTKSLKQLQEDFQAYMLEKNISIKNEVTDLPNTTSIDRLNIYRDGYYLRLLEILEMDFPFIKKLVGQKTFDMLGREYINTYSSNHFSIRVFGRYFSKFLASHPNADPILSEMAMFEWKLIEVQDAGDASLLTIEDMAKIPYDAWVNMQLIVHPSVEMKPFFYNIPEIWQAFDQNKKKPKTKHYDNAEYCLFWRLNHQAYFEPLSVQRFDMMKNIQQGKNFGEICEDLCQWLEEEEVIQFAAGTLRNWVSEGVFCAVKFRSEVQSEEKETLTA